MVDLELIQFRGDQIMSRLELTIIEGFDKDSGLKLHRVMCKASIFAECYGIDSKKNAELFAAAPDLLEVLEEIKECSDYWSEYDVPLGIVDRINAAIAKARGEA